MVRRQAISGLALAALVALTGCGPNTEVLTGAREAIRPAATDTTPETPPALRLASARNIEAWPMRAGSASNAMPHARLAEAPAPLWSVSIGAGNSRRQVISVDPVAADGRIFTRDSAATVTAVNTSGQVLWSRDLTPSYEHSRDAHGGGLGVRGDTVYAATGFGELHALDVATGAEKWVQRLDAPITAPTFSGDTIYLVSRDNRAWSIKADTGRIQWELPASPGAAVLTTSPSPAVTDRLVIFPFGSGEVVAALKQSGIRVWGSSVAGARTGVAYGNIADIAADPVVANGLLFAGTPAGRLVAMDARSGARRWTANEGALSPVVAAGGSVFFVSDRAELLRLDAETGARLWASELPFYTSRRLSRRQAVHAHYGPVLAGGQLWLASSDDQLRAFDPETGAQTRQLDLDGGGATRPIIMDGVMYVVSGRGVLHAWR